VRAETQDWLLLAKKAKVVVAEGSQAENST